MVKLYPLVAGTSLGSHKKFLKKLKNKGAKVTKCPEKCDAFVVFCPIASRYETDVNAALTSSAEATERKKVVLVAMHHTFEPNYTLPSCRQMDTGDRDVLFVDCLFYENKGLLRCKSNEMAVKKICTELHIKKKY